VARRGGRGRSRVAREAGEKVQEAIEKLVKRGRRGGDRGGPPGGPPRRRGDRDYPDDPLFAAANRNVDLDRITPPGHVRRTDDRPLVRSDPRHPDHIFENGFQPRDVGPSGNYDLDRHVSQNQPGPFVSTSYGDEVTDGFDGEYRYDIDAPGGIDMRRSPGVRANEGEAEIAFPGGIDPRFVRGAQQYDDWGNPTGDYRPNPHYRDWRT